MLIGVLSGLSKGQVLRYVLTPQIGPRLNDLFGTGFSRLAYLMALIYRAVNILPPTHPLLRPENHSKLSVHKVMAAAASEIKFTRANIDKIIVYFCILAGLILLVAQFVLTLAYLMVNPAFAMPTTYAEFFQNPNYQEDVAYQMLFAVFGVPELFNPGGARNQFHVALHALLQFYSVGLLVVAVLIVCYFIFAVAVETAQTGTPFGRRFKHEWVPLRLVLALGLLIPTGYGLNAAQWITLYSAKFGSDFATRGWTLFNEEMGAAYLENAEQRIGTPQSPELMPLAGSVMIINACRYAYNQVYRDSEGRRTKIVQPYIVRNNGVQPSQRSLDDGITFEDAWNFSGRGDITIRIGEYNNEVHKDELGQVFPYCGDIIIHSSDIVEAGTLFMQVSYFGMVKNMLDFGGAAAGDVYGLNTHAQNYVRRHIQIRIPGGPQPNAPLPPPDYKATLAVQLQGAANGWIGQAVRQQAGSNSWNNQIAWVRDLGWGGAGVWYNKIAEINGSLVTAVNNIPQPSRPPAVLEYLKLEQMKQNVETPEIFGTSGSNGVAIQFTNATEEAIGNVLSSLQKYWAREDARQDALGNQTRGTGNVFIDTINLIFGTRGLFNMCANTDTHPLAQLSLLGKGLVEASIRNLTLGMAFGLGGAMPVGWVGPILQAGSSIMMSVATVTITMGFLLFYVLPFMPFLYFFFAVGGWIKGLFEAMVGVPLWALAHLRIDGEGLPGDAAMDGYYLIFEVFLRPILIVFGLLASVIVFSAMVKVLNEIYYLVIANLSGHDSEFTEFCTGIGNGTGGPAANNISYFRGPIDELFFTIIYAIIVYMIGMACFKLIDLVPNNLLRYMGKSVKTFNDMGNDPAEGLMMRMSIGSQRVSSEIISIGSNASATAANTAKGIKEIAGE